jgi:hypothetical protein
MGLEVDQLVIHVGGLRYQPARPPATGAVAAESVVGAGDGPADAEVAR